jgi:hypothetical protein
VFAAQQKKLQEELQKRADGARKKLKGQGCVGGQASISFTNAPYCRSHRDAIKCTLSSVLRTSDPMFE